MFNKRAHLIRIIKQSIPLPVLQYAFLPDYKEVGLIGKSLEYCINSTVIDNWVLPDINLAGGQEMEVDLLQCKSYDKQGGVVIEVPKRLTQHRNISSVLSSGWSLGTSNLDAMNNPITDALAPVDIATHARIQVTGPNVLYVEGGWVESVRYIRVILENDSEFQNVGLPALQVLGKLCVYATKAFIWNKCIIRMGTAPIIHGVEFDRIANIIEGYEDALELYEEYMKEHWVPVNAMTDPKQKSRYLRMILPR